MSAERRVWSILKKKKEEMAVIFIKVRSKPTPL